MRNTKTACAVLVVSMASGCAKSPAIQWTTDGTPHEHLIRCQLLAEYAPDPKRARTDCMRAVPHSREDR